MNRSTLLARDLVLAGGGHSHALVLRMLAMRPAEGFRVTLVSDVTHAPYSGMLPGLIEGVYTYDEAHIDLRRLCEAAGAVFVRARVMGVDLAAERLRVSDGPPLRFDVLSLNVGAVPEGAGVPGLAAHGVPVKPVGPLLEAWERLATLAAVDPERERVVVLVGAGTGGVEMALAMRRRLPPATRLVLLERGPEVMPGHGARARAILSKALKKAGVEVRTGVEITEVEPGLVHGARGAATPFDALFYATSARAPAWLKDSGLALDERGFVRVATTLRSVSAPRVFAAGDVAAIEGFTLPKSGVYAVREAKPLYHNLLRALSKTPLVVYTPQTSTLALIGLGGGRAAASRGAFATAGRAVWRLKERIDRAFMERFTSLVPMAEPGARLRCHGCAAKVGPGALAEALSEGGGPEEREDAAVLDLGGGRRLLQSLDYITAIVPDPYVLGRIAAAHAFSDVYAMNGAPDSALALVNVPHALPRITQALVARTLAGVTRAMDEICARLVGGHTAEAAELAVGLSVNGFASEGRLWRKAGLRPGDALVLTKPLGIGTLFAAAMRLRAKGRWLDAAIHGMLQTNAAARDVLQRFAVSACTDVTGFGLAGHLGEMLRASGVVARLSLADLPVYEGALDTAAAGLLSSLDPENRAAETLVRAGAARAAPVYQLLFDPQTSGGLLAGVPAADAVRCVAELRARGVAAAAIIGHVTDTGDPCLVVQ